MRDRQSAPAERLDACYRMTLLANLDLTHEDKITPRSYPLGFCFNAPWDEEYGTFELEVGDCFRIFVRLCAADGDSLKGMTIARLNLVGWTSPRASATQIFDTCFRSTGDTPDEYILGRGDLHTTEPILNPPPLSEGTFYPQSASRCADGASVEWEVSVPNRIELAKIGLFSFLVSLSVGTPEGLRNFILDPEMDVGGGYPP